VTPVITRLIRQIAWQLRPEGEAINLLPFRGDGGPFLMDEWARGPASVYAALHAYPFTDGSSNAEAALRYAAEQLAQRVGRRAVLLITDASFSSAYQVEDLWQSLDVGQVQVFALYVPADYDPVRAPRQANLMTDWAGAAGGCAGRFANQADSEAAFRRVVAWLDRPAAYSFTLSVADAAAPEIVLNARGATPDEMAAALAAPPTGPTRAGPIEEVVEDQGRRAAMPRIDLDITFAFNSAALEADQTPLLEALATAIRTILAGNPAEMFLIEGHTDAVGSDLYNRALSERRAEAVADALVDGFGIPRANLVARGFGALFLKIDTILPEEANRRVAVRRITPLVEGLAVPG
jgi:outer membrane protein OmpA-like peptidoglycan-associated protein